MDMIIAPAGRVQNRKLNLAGPEGLLFAAVPERGGKVVFFTIIYRVAELLRKMARSLL